MINDTHSLRRLLDDFHQRWPIERIENLTLTEYVSVKNPDTFCQWVETKTKPLGSIQGINSSKFGIYKRQDPSERPKPYSNDDQYSWRTVFGQNQQEAFRNVLRDVVNTARFAQNGDYALIDSLELTDMYKWKLAYLFSNEQLLPIFSTTAISKVSKTQGISLNQPRSSILQLIMANKPIDQTVYEYGSALYRQTLQIDENTSEKGKADEKPSKGRKAADKLPKGSQKRSGSSGYIADLKHNRLQQRLYDELVSEYLGQDVKVVLEENYVDIKVSSNDFVKLYEVKARGTASDCIRDALGQVLAYAYRDSSVCVKEIIVAGECAPTPKEAEFIEYLKNTLDIKFSYRAISLDGIR